MELPVNSEMLEGAFTHKISFLVLLLKEYMYIYTDPAFNGFLFNINDRK